MKANTRINYQFKILYAIGIFFVVANNVSSGGGVSVFYEFFPAYGFHMGLFIFASGYFYTEKAEEHPGRYIWKKICSLIIPMYLYNFAYAIFTLFMNLRGFTFGANVDLMKLFIEPLTSGHQFGYNLAAWFVAPLFMVEVWNVLLRKCLSRLPQKLKEGFILVLSFALGMLGIYLSTKGLRNDGWLVLNRLLHFMPYYSFGFFYKKYLEKHDKLPNFLYFALVIGAQFAIILYRGSAPTYEVVWCRFSNMNPLPFIAGFLGIAFWLRVSRILEPALGRNRFINYVADNTFAIMENHFLGFFLVKWIYSLIATYTDHFQDFDFNAYHTNIWYYYKPLGLSQTLILYVIAGFAVSLLIAFVLGKIKKGAVKVLELDGKNSSAVQ